MRQEKVTDGSKTDGKAKNDWNVNIQKSVIDFGAGLKGDLRFYKRWGKEGKRRRSRTDERQDKQRDREQRQAQGSVYFFNGRVGDDKRKKDYDGIDVRKKEKEEKNKKDE